MDVQAACKKIIGELMKDIDDNTDYFTGEPCFNNWVVDMQNELTEKHIDIVRRIAREAENERRNE